MLGFFALIYGRGGGCIQISGGNFGFFCPPPLTLVLILSTSPPPSKLWLVYKKAKKKNRFPDKSPLPPENLGQCPPLTYP